MSEIIGAFLCGEIGNGATDPTPEARDRMLGRLAQPQRGVALLQAAQYQLQKNSVRGGAEARGRGPRPAA